LIFVILSRECKAARVLDTGLKYEQELIAIGGEIIQLSVQMVLTMQTMAPLMESPDRRWNNED
jgi:hypothetical protein